MKKLAVQEIEAIVNEAFKAAQNTTNEYILKNGQHYPCGFAWVKIKPARGPFVTYMKKEKLGSTDDFYGGFVVYNPSGNYTQCMDAKGAGARAFADVLRKHGVDARAVTRID